MLYSISSIITKYFFKKNIITNSDQEVFTYGCQLIISSFCSISSILLLSFFINITYGILFLLFFFPIRLFCGGFHASSYIKCFLCTNTIFITEEEVNLYGNCGKDKYRCHNDCIIPFTSLLNSSL